MFIKLPFDVSLFFVNAYYDSSYHLIRYRKELKFIRITKSKGQVDKVQKKKKMVWMPQEVLLYLR